MHYRLRTDEENKKQRTKKRDRTNEKEMKGNDQMSKNDRDRTKLKGRTRKNDKEKTTDKKWTNAKYEERWGNKGEKTKGENELYRLRQHKRRIYEKFTNEK